MFQIQRIGEVALLTAMSRFEGPNRWTAREEIDELLEAKVSKLIIDFTNVDLIDSSGLASVVAAFRRTQAVGGTLCLCSLNEKVQSTIRK